MKRKITIKPEADADLMKIWIYGYWNFGEQLADAYNLKFSQLFDKIALFDLGRKRPDLGYQIYSLPFGEHIVIYRAEVDEIFIGRILHHSQEVSAEF
ncbi:type II toxin-antitoxin system RelE/ParE family toxin [Pantoea rodasii]|uniref:Type II toxin-antitoxin system RelE/ParE family toxin n=1 Tax=Pantoea rodasii TaxID=1076549 RepID=A0A2M9WDS5_9GAMM|nr:type II toxin-antitoxin system RelE/ParE family toxin [Pantoea rodasii]ORM63359.1 plasmid stabilization protein [Pantoea rodasii]PJZ05703.1 type II toxin-antitoxin system RelE/ParE family toxin [Pantoea rodasii]